MHVRRNVRDRTAAGRERHTKDTEMVKITQQDHKAIRKERRSSKRYNAYIPVMLTGENKKGRSVSECAFTVNISREGAFILISNEFEKDTVLDFYLPPFSQKTEKHRIKGKVVRIDKDIRGFDGVDKLGLGISFSDKPELIEKLKTTFAYHWGKEIVWA